MNVRKLRKTARYQRFRKRILIAENYLCRPCREAGRTVEAREIDHIIPVHKDPDLFWDPGNLQPICEPCHEAKTAEENREGETPELKAWRLHLDNFA